RFSEEKKQMKEEQTTGDVLKSAAGFSIGLGILMIVAGFFSIPQPFAAGIGISVFIGWLLVFGGVLYLAYSFAPKGFGSFAWRFLVGALYIFGGFYVIANPTIGLETLTFVVAVVLIAEGILQLVGYFQIRALSGSGWILFDGIVTLLLGILIVY